MMCMLSYRSRAGWLEDLNALGAALHLFMWRDRVT